MKREALFGVLGGLFLAALAPGAANAQCSTCAPGPFGMECKADNSSNSKCQVKQGKSKCKYRVAGKGEIEFGVTKLGTRGGLSGEGELTCEWEVVCEAIASCESKGCTGSLGIVGRTAACMLRQAQAAAAFAKNPPAPMSSRHSYTWYNLDPATAESVSIAMGAE